MRLGSIDTRFERPSREQIDREAREHMAASGVPCALPVHDGPPTFDPVHEAAITDVVDTLDRLWSEAVEVFAKIALKCVPTITTGAGPHTCTFRFDLSDVQHEWLDHARELFAEAEHDIGGESGE